MKLMRSTQRPVPFERAVNDCLSERVLIPSRPSPNSLCIFVEVAIGNRLV